ncbi:hypothetical protein BOTBODRAFT_182019 [Botryobasidium botryosum FD-172 SS1]|uniref:Uncharacterized protein n=1 Tax=Botryobasidium botryosum (strain FD-172 SS1) TaxID=930990 RepID=A0A067LSG3_BOTB1|nr:hypothetical protein BOTBODRAFT_182019 [Botryobasidium botryosum FD-172 SS1]
MPPLSRVVNSVAASLVFQPFARCTSQRLSRNSMPLAAQVLAALALVPGLAPEELVTAAHGFRSSPFVCQSPAPVPSTSQIPPMSPYRPLLDLCPPLDAEAWVLEIFVSAARRTLPHPGPAVVDPYTIALRAVVDEMELHLVVRHRAGDALPPRLHPDHPDVVQWAQALYLAASRCLRGPISASTALPSAGALPPDFPVCDPCRAASVGCTFSHDGALECDQCRSSGTFCEQVWAPSASYDAARPLISDASALASEAATQAVEAAAQRGVPALFFAAGCLSKSACSLRRYAHVGVPLD